VPQLPVQRVLLRVPQLLRELPVQPDHVGTRLVLQPGEKLALSQRTNGMFELRVESVQA